MTSPRIATRCGTSRAPAARLSPRCAVSWRSCDATAIGPSSPLSLASTVSTHSLPRSTAPGCLSICMSTGNRSRSRRESTCPPIASCRRGSPTRSSTPAPATPRSPSATPRTRCRSRFATTERGAGAATNGARGHGLIGIGERVKLYGGEMARGPGKRRRLSPQHPSSAGPVPLMKIRVLIADDQSMVRAGFRMLLSGEEDVEVVAEASDGLEAVAKAARFDPTVILMDIRMPELDGLQATRRILAADDTARILILTTFGLDEYVYEALGAGASGFVLKDDPPEQLIAAVRTVAAGDALLSPAVTKRVIKQFTRMSRPAPPEGTRRAHRTRAGHPAADRQRPVQRGDRATALHQRNDGQDPRHARPSEARPARSRPGGRPRVSDRHRRGGPARLRAGSGASRVRGAARDPSSPAAAPSSACSRPSVACALRARPGPRA